MMRSGATKSTLLAFMLALAGCADNSTAGGNADKDAGGNGPGPSEQDGGGTSNGNGDIPGDMNMGGFGVDLSDPDAKYAGTLEVVQEDGKPAAAMLSVGTKSYASDADGKITITDLPAAKTVSGVIKSQGFLSRGVKLSFAAVGQGAKRIVLEKVGVLSTIQASAGGVVDATTTQVSFPANAFLDADGEVYKGKAVVSAAAQDPASIALNDYENGESFELRSDFDFDRVPDGYLFAEQADGSISFQYPESVFSVDIADEDGNALTINPSATATFRMRLPSITQRLAGDVVDVYTFDETALRWVVDGKCTVEAVQGGLDCVGEAKHFSARSMPVNADGKASCFEYRVERKNFPAEVKVRQWSLSQAGTSTFRAEVNELSAQGMCHVSAQSKGRLVLEITSGGETRLFESAWDEGIPAIKFSAADITKLNDKHECPACVVRVVVADWNKLGKATDGDGDGFFVGTGVNTPDCDDKDEEVYPGAVETVCNTKDLNCDKSVPPGWSMKTRTQAAADGVTASIWNGTLCGLTCIVPDSLEERSTRPEWDDNCDGSLNCPANTELVEGTCQPYKNCAQVTCSTDATCSVKDMRAECNCNPGFTGDGNTCIDDNECLTNNGGCGSTAAWTCVNNRGAARTCNDINECASGNGGCEVGCMNTTGSFTCTCGEGEALNVDGKTCDAADACTGNPCDAQGDASSTCTVESFGYTCSCSEGYEVTGSATQVCSDSDGCDVGAIEACLGAANCLDEPAPSVGYRCECGQGYVAGEGTQACLDFDACDLQTNPCTAGGDLDGQCSDDVAPSTGYSCVCSEAYLDNGTTCSMAMTCSSCGDPGCCQNPECLQNPVCMVSSCANNCGAPGCCLDSICLGNPICGSSCIPGMPGCPGGPSGCPGPGCP